MIKTKVNRRRLAVCVISGAVLLSLLFAVLFTALEVRHDCTGDGCPVCAVLDMCRDTINTAAGCAVIKTALCIAVFAALLTAALSVLYVRASSPVVLRVRLIN